MFKNLQKLGKAFMLPIAILPGAGLLLGVGGAFSNPATIATYPILDNHILQTIFIVMKNAGEVVFSNLPILLCIGLVIGLCNGDKGTAALAAFVGYVVMNQTAQGLLKVFPKEGVNSIDTGTVGAIVVGFLVTWLHNRYRNIQLPQILGFFGGSRFVPIISSLISIFIGVFFFLVWPSFQQLLLNVGGVINSTGPIGTGIYGAFLRLCGVIGLHHAIYPLFWYTELGGVEMVNGVQVVGAQKIAFAQLIDPNHVGLFTEGTRFFAGKFAMMIFGLPAGCLAMYHMIDKAKRKKYAGLFLGVALTSILTGITEPAEFMFLFVSPALYLIHTFLDGMSFLLTDLLNINVVNTFSGGIIDFTLFGILQGNDKTNWIRIIPLGISYSAIYYIVFRTFIKFFDVKTPGRGNEESEEEVKVETKASLKEDALKIIEALGNKENIEHVDACITRLRVSVKDASLVNKQVLKQLGAVDVLEVGGGIQAIYGAKAILFKNIINDLLGLEE